MKLDCSITENFLREKERMWKNGDVFPKADFKSFVEQIAFIQQWSNSHQCKTYLEDFKEKFPNFSGKYSVIYNKRAKEWICVRTLYGKAPKETKLETADPDFEMCSGECEKCWNQPINN